MIGVLIFEAPAETPDHGVVRATPFSARTVHDSAQPEAEAPDDPTGMHTGCLDGQSGGSDR